MSGPPAPIHVRPRSPKPLGHRPGEPPDLVIGERDENPITAEERIVASAVRLLRREGSQTLRTLETRVASITGCSAGDVFFALSDRKDIFSVTSRVSLTTQSEPTGPDWDLIRDRFKDGQTISAIVRLPSGTRLTAPVSRIDRVVHAEHMESWVSVRVSHESMWARLYEGACVPSMLSFGFPLLPASSQMPASTAILCWRTVSPLAATQHLHDVLFDRLPMPSEGATASFRTRPMGSDGGSGSSNRRTQQDRGAAAHWCTECGQPLTTASSIRAGVGPTCAKRADGRHRPTTASGRAAFELSGWQKAVCGDW